MAASPQIEIPVGNKVDNTTPRINVSISTDTLLILGVLVWALWDKVMKPSVVDKLDGVFAPIQEERKLSGILAQIGIITGASRVVLAAFHNGALDSEGYHLQKLSTVNTYTSPGHLPMSYPIRDLPIGRIMYELEEMMKTDGWVCVRYSEDLPQACRDHLLKNSIYKMCNRLVRVGNLPIGILSLQHEGDSRIPLSKQEEYENEKVTDESYYDLLEDLYGQIAAIMRRRIVHPSPIHRVFGKLLGTLRLTK
jgi:hypothetical protein